jgi:hypothetical protein
LTTENEMKEFVITIKCNVKGEITLSDSRSDVVNKGLGIILTMGDHTRESHCHFAWGSYQSIIYGFYGGVMEAKYDTSETGDFYRAVFGGIARMLTVLHGFLKKSHEFVTEEVGDLLKRWEKEDAEKGTVH